MFRIRHQISSIPYNAAKLIQLKKRHYSASPNPNPGNTGGPPFWVLALVGTYVFYNAPRY